MINRQELIKKYLDFFKSKNHKEIPNARLIPENDPTVLFTTAGMHPLVPYLLGQPHPLGRRLCNVQKCVRTGDIEEVGDETHHTFFEMMGNWSLGDYFKKESINYSFEFLTNILKIPKENISVTCFAGDKNASKDNESAEMWKGLGIKKIKFLPKEDNWWGPAGKSGPCGPDTEIFSNNVEIWNNVFMQYNKTAEGKYIPLKQKNVDTGMGVERTLALLNNLKDNYMTDCFKPIIEKIEKSSGKKYGKNKEETKAMRIIADHIKASVFIIADGVAPSNKEQGYILRRLIRRAVRYGRDLEMTNFLMKVAEPIFVIYSDYENLQKNKKKILEELEREEVKFLETLEKGMNIFVKLTKDKKEINCKDAFLLYQSYGFPVEMIEEECLKRKIKFSKDKFENECRIHQETSRTASRGKFKSGLADNSEKTTRLHTASHLLLAALRIVLKDKNIIQKGSNITPQRLRLDFNFPRKMTDEEIKKTEEMVNSEISKSCRVIREEMSPNEARKKGAGGIFNEKYGDIVSVYTIEDFSKEICAGPHVKNTCEIGHFKIEKEESSSSGVRRIKAVVD
ncbi:Alanine--tRNA ligase [uncultured archaeon]|nr:Alanine--tRNA ligase [uncultured archaeon]